MEKAYARANRLLTMSSKLSSVLLASVFLISIVVVDSRSIYKNPIYFVHGSKTIESRIDISHIREDLRLCRDVLGNNNNNNDNKASGEACADREALEEQLETVEEMLSDIVGGDDRPKNNDEVSTSRCCLIAGSIIK